MARQAVSHRPGQTISHVPRQRVSHEPAPRVAHESAPRVSHEPRHAVSHVEWELGDEILEPQSVLPLFVQVAYLAFGVITARRMEEGSPLPSEPSLAARWGVSRETVHKAFALLQEEGIIRTRRGVGYYVSFEPRMRRVIVQPGSVIYARPPTPNERADLVATPWGTPVLVVEEPGKCPAVRDAISTIIHTAGS